MNKDTVGYAYLLHFSEPYKHAQHYLGWTNNLFKRIKEHNSGSRERCVLTHVAKANGIKFKLVRTWQGPLEMERKLKAKHNSRLLCPICNPKITNFERYWPWD